MHFAEEQQLVNRHEVGVLTGGKMLPEFPRGTAGRRWCIPERSVDLSSQAPSSKSQESKRFPFFWHRKTEDFNSESQTRIYANP